MHATLVEYNAYKKRYVRGTHVDAGQKLYAVEYDGWYFIWSYSSEEFARKMVNKLCNGPSSVSDLSANWRRDLRDLIPSDRKAF